MNPEAFNQFGDIPLSPDERQFEDLRYSPDDFDGTLQMSRDAFIHYFRVNARELIDAYAREDTRASRYLREEAIYPDEELARIYRFLCSKVGKKMLTWGDFAEFRSKWTKDWDKRHGYDQETTANLPDERELSA